MGNLKELEQRLKLHCDRYPYLRNVQTIYQYTTQ